MDTEDYLLVSTQATTQWSAALYNYQSLSVLKYYRNGGTFTPKTINILGEDYILAAQATKPTLHVWQLNSQEQSKNIRLILPETANCMDVCPQNTYIAIGISNKLYVWNISGKLHSVQQKNYQAISNIKFSSDGQFLTTAGQDGMLITYKVADLVSIHNNYLTQSDIGQVEPLYTKNDNSMPINDLHLGNFGRKSRIVTVSSDHTCRVYCLNTGELLLTLVLNEPLNSVIFDKPSWNIFIGTFSGRIIQFYLKNPPRTLTHHIDNNSGLLFNGHKKKVTCLDLNLTNTILASGSDDNFVYTWELKSRQILKKIELKSSITNLKFVLSFKNFTVDNFKPKILLQSLERSLDLTNQNFNVAFNQDEDIELSDDEMSLSLTKTRQDLEKENKRLRFENKRMQHCVFQISQKLLK